MERKFELSDGSFSVSGIQEYFEYILKKCGEKTGNKTGGKTDNFSITIDISKIENIIMFKIKTEYYLELLTTETMKFLGITKS